MWLDSMISKVFLSFMTVIRQAVVVAQLQGQQEESQARDGSWGKPSAHPANPWQGSSSGARQAVAAGQGTVPGMGSAISKPLQSSGTAPRVLKDRGHPRPSQEEPPWGDALGTHPVGAGWQNMTPSLAGTVAQALPAPRKQSPSAPGSHSLWQPRWAVVRLLIHPVQHRHTNTAAHLAVPMKGPRNVSVVLTGNLQCLAQNRNMPGELGSHWWEDVQTPSQPTLPVPGSSGLLAEGLGLCLFNSVINTAPGLVS